MEILPVINWIKNDPEKYNCFWDGSEFLCAIRVTNNETGVTKWEFHNITIQCDDEVMHLMENDGPFSAWEFSDFEYFHLISGTMPSTNIG